MGEVSDDQLRRLRHDLRSPLIVISGFARLLGADKEMTPEERRDFSTRIERAADDIRRTLDDVLG